MPLLPARPLGLSTAFGAAVLGFTGCQPPGVPPAAPPPPKVTVARPVSYPVPTYREYNGHLDPIHAVEVKARVKGLLREVHFKEGEEVAKGAPLYSIDPREYRTAVARAGADLAKAAADIGNWKAQIKLAEAELGRAERSAASGASAQTDVDKARATVEVNAAQLAVSEANKEAAAAALQTANIQLGYTDIRAEIAGRINRTLVTPGNLVGQDSPTLLTTIVALDPLYINFDAPEQDLIDYQRAFQTKAPPTGAEVLPVEIGVTNEVGFPHPGAIDFQENRVDRGTGTVRIRGRVPNPPVPPTNARVLYPGLYARVRVPFGGPRPLLVIPEDALGTGQEGRYVLVVGADNKVEKRTVTVGPAVWRASPSGETGSPPWTLTNPNPPPVQSPAGDKGPPPPAAPTRLPLSSVVSIEKGLSPDDRIVVNGLQRARPGLPVAPEDWSFKAPPPPAPPSK